MNEATLTAIRQRFEFSIVDAGRWNDYMDHARADIPELINAIIELSERVIELESQPQPPVSNQSERLKKLTR